MSNLTIRVCRNPFYSKWCEKFGAEAIINQTKNDLANLRKVKEHLIIRTFTNEEKMKGYVLCLSDWMEGEVFFVPEEVSTFIANLK